MNKNTACKYQTEYPFFRLLSSYSAGCMLADRNPEDVLHAIFHGTHSANSVRYAQADLIGRTQKKLLEINEVLPGTWHENAEMLDFSYRTENLISFPECANLMKSFLQMVDDLEKLFFKALDTDLSAEEQEKLDFLVESLNVTDICMPMVRITYDSILILRDVYKKENLKDFLSYVNIRAVFDSNLWRCKEFFDDPETAQRFLNVIPDSKLRMREFALLAAKFDCRFTWSDAKPIMYSEDEELEWQATGEYIAVEERRKEETEIWVDKTEKELGDWKPYIDRVLLAAGSKKLGGMKPPYREHGAFGPINLTDGTKADRHLIRVQAWQKAGKPLFKGGASDE